MSKHYGSDGMEKPMRYSDVDEDDGIMAEHRYRLLCFAEG